jgi:enoyl-CoA hydratase/carnithine racemase
VTEVRCTKVLQDPEDSLSQRPSPCPSSKDLLASAHALARLVLEAPDDALRFTKERMVRSEEPSFEACLAEEHDRAFREIAYSPGRWR